MMFSTGFGRRVLTLAIAAAAGCGSNGESPSPRIDAGTDGGTFTIGPSGTTRQVALSGGGTLAFAFPAAAAGKSVTLREVTPASLGLDGQLDAVVEMLPRGETFGSPVLVTGNWPGAPPALLTFDSRDTFDMREPLLLAGDGQPHALSHFAYVGVTGAGSASACPNGTLQMTSTATASSTCCPTGGQSTIWTCAQPGACRSIVGWPYETCASGPNGCAALFTPSYSAVMDTCVDGGAPDGVSPDAATDGGVSDASDAGDARSDAADAPSDGVPNGETCAMPYVITKLPFADTVDLATKANDFMVNTMTANFCAQQTPDAGAVRGGDLTGDVVYAYTATANASVQVTISAEGADVQRTALMIVVTWMCDAAQKYCLGSYLTDPATDNTRTFRQATTAGATYYFIVDGGGDLPPKVTLKIDP
jgi:hypothetical protein